ncbi:MAG: 4'-phosphopantetheinyl transferase superfamily protein [Bacteroidales bacterium]|nr:4'-phosphopantetheinyl transferase superfamily protein [Bacteroidales bacterium]
MEYFVFKIEDCEKAFGIDKSLSRPKQISLLAKQQLLSIIKEKGLSFDTTIAVGEKGKPFFLYNDTLHFSISHTKSHIAIAIHDKEIGIDIESLRKCNLSLVERFFNPLESDYISSQPKEQQSEVFTRIWTLKEAFVKQQGTGIAGNFDKSAFSLQGEKIQSTIENPNLKFESKYIEQENLYLAICYLEN